MPILVKSLFINQNGRVVCLDHGGSYLQSALKRDPHAVIIDTPLDNWIRLNAAEIRTARIVCDEER